MYGSLCIGGACGCTSQSDCAGGQACNGTTCQPSCVDGGTDCSLGTYYYTYCDPTTGLCSPCTDDQQCIGSDAGPRCLSDITANCGCRSSTDCTSPTVCSTSSFTCIPSCAIDGGTQCIDLVCDPSAGLCVQCLDDTQCTTDAPICTADVDAGNYCVQCLTANDCPASAPLCSYNSCVPSCVFPDGGTSCPYGVCDVGTGICVQCLTDGDCQFGGAVRCTADIDAGNYCVQCLTANDCGDAGPCASGAFQCGYCSVDADCPAEVPTCISSYCTDGGF
jgi:hypothetical protein